MQLFSRKHYFCCLTIRMTLYTFLYSYLVKSAYHLIRKTARAAAGQRKKRRPVVGFSQPDLFDDLDSSLSLPRTTQPLAGDPAGFLQKTLVPVPPPPSPTLPGGRRQILLRDKVVGYSLTRSSLKTIGFLINESGLRVTAPRWVTLTDIENALHEKQRWILTKLQELRQRQERRAHPPTQWQDGGAMPYLGQMVTLRLHATQDNTAACAVTISTARPKAPQLCFDADAQILNIHHTAELDAPAISRAVLVWLQEQAVPLFQDRLLHYAARLGVRYRAFGLSSARTQWGSCTADGMIRLNWRLMHFAPDIIDYVVAHELAHLLEMNHSAAFWREVEKIYPDYVQARKLLRSVPQDTLPVF